MQHDQELSPSSLKLNPAFHHVLNLLHTQVMTNNTSFVEWIYFCSLLDKIFFTNYHPILPILSFYPTTPPPPAPSPSAYSAVPPCKDEITTPAPHHQVSLSLHLQQGQGEEGRRGGSWLSAPLFHLAWTTPGQQWMPKIIQVSHLNLRKESV